MGLIAIVPTLGGCEFTRKKDPSVLLIAVEGLTFNSMNCEAEELGDMKSEGLRTFCRESVRFTHAYTPSTMSQAALASLLTGLYPLDHGVRTNGSDFLSARFRTLSEVASSKRYGTLFISGGPPIWRKSGLAQGFEVFEDSADVNPVAPYRPAKEVVDIALSWLDQNGDRRPTFVVLYLADLQFPFVQTETNDGEVRDKSFTSQVEEVLESLASLAATLKKRRKWNQTHVVLAGLNSLDKSMAPGEPLPLNLKSSGTQVALFIKPARRERDAPLHWAVDRNVSLVDVSHTIFDWLKTEPPATSLAELQPKSLISALASPEPSWNENRIILSESAWPDWLEGAGVRWALRQKQFLYIHDRVPLIFNTLTDKLENMPLKPSDPLWTSLNGDVVSLLEKAKVRPFEGLSSYWPEQLNVAKEIWREGRTHRRPEGDEPWSKWYLRHALMAREWRQLKTLAQDMGEPVAAYVAAKHMGESLPLPRNSCVRLILGSAKQKMSAVSECEDEKVLALHSWRTADREEDRLRAQDRFTRAYIQTALDQELGRQNYLNGLRWDVDREWPLAPEISDYLLTLKEFEPLARKLPKIVH